MQRKTAATVILANCLWATVAWADAGLPMIFVSMQALALAIIPIILIEAFILGRGLQLPWQRAVTASAEANLISAFVGVPVVWLLMAILEFATGGGGADFTTLAEKILSVTRDAAWIYPYEDWQIPVAQLVLLVPFFLASVWIETRVLTRTFGKDEPRVRQLCLRANLATYALLAIITLGALFWTLIPTTVLWTYTPAVDDAEFSAFESGQAKALADLKVLHAAISSKEFVGGGSLYEAPSWSPAISRAQKEIDCRRFYAITLTLVLPGPEAEYLRRHRVPICGKDSLSVTSPGRLSWRKTDAGLLGLAVGGFPDKTRYLIVSEGTADEIRYRLEAVIDRP